MRLDLFNRRFITLPRRTTNRPSSTTDYSKNNLDVYNLPIHTFHIRHPFLTFRPLLEAMLMDVVPTGSLTPHYLLVFGLEFHKTYRAVAGDMFAV